MTNYCQNLLTITANETTDGIPLNLYEDITYSSSYLGLSFETLLPVPNEVKDEEEKWRIEHWGTYGLNGSSGIIRETDEEFLTIRFETYETPPLLWVKHVSSLYDDLTFDISYLNILSDISGFRSFISGVEVENSIDIASFSAWKAFGYTEDIYNIFVQNNKKGNYVEPK